MFLSDPRALAFHEKLMELWEEYRKLFPDKKQVVSQDELLEMQRLYGADNYQREYDLVVSHAEGVFIWDMAGKRYICMNATYSAIAHGYGNIELIGEMVRQMFCITSVQNRFVNNMQPQLLKRIAELTGLPGAILMNTGAEAFDTAVKAARQWAYVVKKVPNNRARIITAYNNFHGRTLAAIAASGTKKYRKNFGPFPRGFKKVPYGDIAALERAMTENTAAFIIEPIQGEGGIVLPPERYLEDAWQLCAKRNVLLIFDEIQTGLGRTGKLFAHSDMPLRPDGILLGKALGAYMPVSAFVAAGDVLKCFKPGSHGSTFGGTPLSCGTALKSLDLVTRDNFALVRNSERMGKYLLEELQKIRSPLVKEVRGKGLFVGMEMNKKRAEADAFFVKLKENGLIAGVAGNNTVRFTPPLVINKEEIDLAVKVIAETLSQMK